MSGLLMLIGGGVFVGLVVVGAHTLVKMFSAKGNRKKW